jgi:serine/threonine protein kinase
LLTEDLQVKICDFGFGRSLTVPIDSTKRRRKLSFNVYTRYYRPPEVSLSCSNYNEKADIWSLGCLLSEVM